MPEAPIDPAFRPASGGVLPPAVTQRAVAPMALARIGSRSKQRMDEGHVPAPCVNTATSKGSLANGTMTLAQLAEARGMKPATTSVVEGEEGGTPAEKKTFTLADPPKPTMSGSRMAAMIMAKRKP